MSITTSVRALLGMVGKKQRDLLPVFGLANVQSLSNKCRGERWSAADLVAVADACGAKLAFVLPDGERVLISADPVQASPAVAAADPVQASAGADPRQAYPAGDIGGAAGGRVTHANAPEK